MLKRKLLILLALVAVGCSLAAATVSKAYGVRVYSDASATSADLVSFDVDAPGSVDLEMTLPFATVRAAAGDGHTYYMLDSDDGLLPDHLYKMDLDTREIVEVVEYELYSAEKSLIISDMTYDATTGKLYMFAFDIASADVNEDEISADLGLYSMNPSTGRVELVCIQEWVNFIAIAAAPDGSLKALAEDGNVWEINKTTGRPELVLGYAAASPGGLQSMSYDDGDGTLYWTAFAIDGNNGVGFLAKFVDNPDEGLIYSEIGILKDNAEIIGLHIDSNPVAKTAPMSVSDLKVVPAANGGKSAVISWVNPKVDLSGRQLAGTFNVNIYRNDVKVTTLSSQTAGSAASWTDKDINGLMTYKVVAENADGEGKPAFSDAVFVGADAPGKVTNLKAARLSSGYDITVSWLAPVDGKFGGWFDSSNLTYKVVRYPDAKVVADNLAANSFTDTGISQTYGYYYEVVASNSAGVGATAQTNTVVSGPALAVPYSCDFSTDDQFRLWTIFDADNDGQTWYLSQNYGGTSDSFLKFFPDNELSPDVAADDWAVSAPINFQAGKTYAIRYSLRILYGVMFPLTYSVTIGNGAAPASQTSTIASYVKADNGGEQTFVDYVELFTVPATGDYNIGFHVQNAVMAQITNVVVEEVQSVDLAAVGMSGLKNPVAGNPAKYSVEIFNNGSTDVTSFKLSLVDEAGHELAAKQVVETVAAQQTAVFDIEWTPELSKQMSISAKVEALGDTNSDNNVSSPFEVDVLKPGKWYDYTPGTDEAATTPFYLDYPSSAVQTIYTKDMLNLPKGTIEGMMLYYNVYNNQPVEDFKAIIGLANTGLAEFDSYQPEVLGKNDFTMVYSGNVHIDPYQHTLTLIFDKPFVYKGDNICLLTVQESNGGDSMVRWIAYYDSLDPTCHMARYRGEEIFDFTQPMGAYEDLTNVSFYMSAEGAGVADVTVDASTITLRLVGKTVVADAECQLRAYSLSGCLVASTDGAIMSLDGCASGVYVVEATAADGRKSVAKIVLK